MVKIKKYNESHVKIFCDDDISMNLALAFSTNPKGYEFDYRYKCGAWDGKIYQYDYTNDLLPLGLTFKCAKYLQNTLKQEIQVDNDIFVKADSFSDEYIKKFIKEDLKHTAFEPYDYQLHAIREMVYHRRMTVECATGSGKSFIMYVVICLILKHYHKYIKHILVFVPDISLIKQIIYDFNDYSHDGKFADRFICNYKDKKSNIDMSKRIHITNYQAIFRKPKSFFEKFDALFVDECHNVSGSDIKNFAKCALNTENAIFKFGLCGKMTEDKTLRMNCEGLFGPIVTIKEAYELIEDGRLANFKAKLITINYSEERKHKFYKWVNDKGKDGKPTGREKYTREVEYLNTQSDRRSFVCKLAATRKHNTLVLVKRKEGHGHLLYEELKEKYPKKTIFYFHGGIKSDEREKMRLFANENNDVIIIATVKTFSEGINVKNLHNIILAESFKAEIRLIQTIGRILRLHDSKSIAILYDLHDDLRLSSNHPYNYSLKHMIERVNIYDSNRYEYETTHYDL